MPPNTQVFPSFPPLKILSQVNSFCVANKCSLSAISKGAAAFLPSNTQSLPPISFTPMERMASIQSPSGPFALAHEFVDILFIFSCDLAHSLPFPYHLLNPIHLSILFLTFRWPFCCPPFWVPFSLFSPFFVELIFSVEAPMALFVVNELALPLLPPFMVYKLIHCSSIPPPFLPMLLTISHDKSQRKGGDGPRPFLFPQSRRPIFHQHKPIFQFAPTHFHKFILLQILFISSSIIYPYLSFFIPPLHNSIFCVFFFHQLTIKSPFSWPG